MRINDRKLDLYYIKKSLKFIRKGLILGTIVYLIFGMIDFLLIDRSFLKLLVIVRFVLIVPLLCLTLLITYYRWFLKYHQVVLFIAALIAGGGVISMQLINYDQSFFPYYLCGMILCLFGINTTLRIKFQYATIASIIIIAGYAIAIVFMLKQHQWISRFVLIQSPIIVAAATGLSLNAAFVSQNMMIKDYFNYAEILVEKNLLFHAKSELEKSNSVKSKLLSIISHDIKGPLSSISGMLQLTEDQMIDQSDFVHYSKELRGRLDATKDLLENLLTWSFLNNAQLVKKEIRLNDTVEETLDLFTDQAKGKNNVLVSYCDPQLTLRTDPEAFKLIIRNLVSNAVKFTENGSVVIKTQSDCDDFIKVSVCDTGPGIPDKVASTLFDWRAKQTKVSAHKLHGSGIGLLLTKDFTEKIGGRLEFETLIGKGTIFNVVLPTRS